MPDPLPEGWCWEKDPDGRVYYVSPHGESTYVDPRMPPGWAYAKDAAGKWYFISPTGYTTYMDPRAPSALSASQCLPPPAPKSRVIVVEQTPTWFHRTRTTSYVVDLEPATVMHTGNCSTREIVFDRHGNIKREYYY